MGGGILLPVYKRIMVLEALKCHMLLASSLDMQSSTRINFVEVASYRNFKHLYVVAVTRLVFSI